MMLAGCVGEGFCVDKRKRVVLTEISAGVVVVVVAAIFVRTGFVLSLIPARQKTARR